MLPTKADSHVIERLNIFVREKGWSKAAFGRAIGVQRQNVDRYLSGDADPAKIVIKLITYGLNPDWLFTGKGEMLSGKQPLNADGEPVQQLLNVEETKAEYRMDGPYLMPAIGPQMTPEHIKEGDRLLIDPKATPEAGDFILTHTPGGPAIEKFSPGKPLIGVVVKLLRERPILRQ